MLYGNLKQHGRWFKMAGTRTAPAVTGAITSCITTVHLIDASGDKFTDALVTLAIPTAIDVESWAGAYQAASQASVYKISQSFLWEGDADTDNAEVGQRNSISDGINLLFKNVATQDTMTPRLIAPVGDVMQGNQDIPLLSSIQMTALILAELTILVGYALQSAQFTGRRERSNNPRISA